MKSFRVLIVALVVTFAASTAAMAAQAAQGTKPTPPAQVPPPQAPPKPTPPPTPPPAPKDPKALSYEDTIVVSASKTEQKIVDAPATMTVFTPKMLENTPAANYGDLLRAVPGVNVTQMSARDINITSRGATGSLSTSQLALVDGRSIYQDFFGFIMWDFMPANLFEIKQIEVIRGPASAVWGANALNGVVNVITKSPREMRGASVQFGWGTFDKNVTNNVTNVANNAAAGNQFYMNGTLADTINDEWSYKLSAGYSMSDAYARPLGNLPNALATPYPDFTNQGTRQPKGDVRFDRDTSNGGHLSFSGGSGATAGIMESGIGPFDIQRGTILSYGKVLYSKQGFHMQAFINALDGKAPNLLSTDSTGTPVQLNFNTKTFDFELGDSRAVNAHNVVTYGGNLRQNQFHLTLAPGETSRTEGGGYVQDEVFFNDHFRVVAGARVDKFSSLSSAVFSPRVAFVIKPQSDQTIRISYNRAFRAPSMINNNLDVTIGTPFPLATLNPLLGKAVFYVPTKATGATDLTEEHIDAFEVSYTGKVGPRSLLSAAWYYNRNSNEIFFTTKSVYGLTAPPAGWTSLPIWPAGPARLPTAIGTWSAVQTKANFPSEYTYKNLGMEKNQGLELGWDSAIGNDVTYYLNYAYTADPKPVFPGYTDAQAMAEINIPSKTKINGGVTANAGMLFGTVSASYSDKAFWQDVLDSRYNGYTSSYTIVNVMAGLRFNHGNSIIQARVNNIANKAVQQHVFGDVIKRSIVLELKLNMPKK